MAEQKTALDGVLIRLKVSNEHRPVYFVPMAVLEKYLCRVQPTPSQHKKLDDGPGLRNVDKAWRGMFGETTEIHNIGNNGQFPLFRSGAI